MAPKKFVYRPKLIPQTMAMLKDRGEISSAEISRETGMSTRHVFMLQQGKCPAASVVMIERLYQYLVFRGMNPDRYTK